MTFLYILLALVVLLVMITVHEFGHYIAGKIFGFKINEFSIGFGPALYKRTRKDGEIFAIRALPLGGYCAFEGEDEEGKDKPDSFNSRPAWKRLIVLLSGVTFNFLFGILTAAIYLFVSGYTAPRVVNTVSNRGVETMGLKENDIILAVDGKRIEAYRSFGMISKKFAENEEYTVTVNRDGQIIDVVTKNQKFPSFYFVNNDDSFKKTIFVYEAEAYRALTDEEIKNFNKNLMSVSTAGETDENKGSGFAIKSFVEGYYYKIDETTYKPLTDETTFNLFVKGSEEVYPLISYAGEGLNAGFIQSGETQDYSFFECIGKAWPFSFYLCKTILSALGGLFTGATALKDMGGTITAVSQIAEISQMGIEYFLLLLPLLAMNLALFNILPIPSLDGARSLFVVIEMIFRKPVPRKIEGWIHTVGLFLLLGLVVFFDIYHFAVAARLLL